MHYPEKSNFTISKSPHLSKSLSSDSLNFIKNKENLAKKLNANQKKIGIPLRSFHFNKNISQSIFNTYINKANNKKQKKNNYRSQTADKRTLSSFNFLKNQQQSKQQFKKYTPVRKNKDNFNRSKLVNNNMKNISNSISTINHLSVIKPKLKRQTKLLQNYVTQVVKVENINNSNQQFENDLIPIYPYYINKNSKFYEHVLQSLSTFHLLKGINKPKLKQLNKLDLPKKQYYKDKFTVVIDLDQTLIHCNQSIFKTKDLVITIKFPNGQSIEAGINIRPYAKQFIQKLSQFAQIIVFTASQKCYGNVILDHLDPNHEYISHRLFRENCHQTFEGMYIKDLRVINRPLSEMVLVDNAPYSYIFQLSNGIPIIPYYNDKRDEQLLGLLNYLRSLKLPNIMEQNQRYFKLFRYLQFKDPNKLIRALYNGIQ